MLDSFFYLWLDAFLIQKAFIKAGIFYTFLLLIPCQNYIKLEIKLIGQEIKWTKSMRYGQLCWLESMTSQMSTDLTSLELWFPFQTPGDFSDFPVEHTVAHAFKHNFSVLSYIKVFTNKPMCIAVDINDDIEFCHVLWWT